MSALGRKRKQKPPRNSSNNRLPYCSASISRRRDESSPLLSVFDNVYETVYNLKTHYFSVDKKVGITAKSRINGVALPFWRVEEVEPGSQAHDFHIRRGAYIIYVNGERIQMNGDPLHEIVKKAKDRSIEIGSEFTISFGQYRPLNYGQNEFKGSNSRESIENAKAREQEQVLDQNIHRQLKE